MSPARFLVGDVFDRMAEVPTGSVDLIMTSPPFLALRSYLPADHPDKAKEIGSESTPAAFIDTLLDLAVEWRRIFAPHGSIVVELGDTYAGSGGAGGDYNEGGLREGQAAFVGSKRTEEGSRLGVDGRNSGNTSRGTKAGGDWPLSKSLACIPDLYKASLSYGRNLLTGREIEPWRVRNSRPWLRTNPPVGALGGKWRPGSSYCVVATLSARNYFDEQAIRVGEDLVDWFIDNGGGYDGAHYAVFPPSLPARFIAALCPFRICQKCNVPSRRITERSEDYARARAEIGDFNSSKRRESGSVSGSRSVLSKAAGREMTRAEYETVGWTDCEHSKENRNWRPGLVLDPFAGSGTTLAVATGLGRDAIGIDIDERNLDLARERVGMFLVEGPDIVDVAL